MFVQVIEGTTTDADALKCQFQAWADKLGPGAEGFLGTTAGVTAEGRFIALARFDSEEHALRNSDRAEQGAWWEQTARLFEGDVTFLDSTDVDVMGNGGSDEAGFVQVMRGRTSDRRHLKELEGRIMPRFLQLRPDYLGGLRVWDDDVYVEVAYFTSEEEARAREEEPAPEELEATFEELMSLTEGAEYYDLTDPWLQSP